MKTKYRCVPSPLEASKLNSPPHNELFDRIMFWCDWTHFLILILFDAQEEDPIEAVYEFPLDSNAAVCSFIAEIDGKKVVGEVKEKEEAREVYDDAIAEGHGTSLSRAQWMQSRQTLIIFPSFVVALCYLWLGAYLLEEKKPNLFEASVGNLPPKKEVLISITYVTELFFDENKVFCSPSFCLFLFRSLVPLYASNAYQNVSVVWQRFCC